MCNRLGPWNMSINMENIDAGVVGKVNPEVDYHQDAVDPCFGIFCASFRRCQTYTKPQGTLGMLKDGSMSAVELEQKFKCLGSMFNEHV